MKFFLNFNGVKIEILSQIRRGNINFLSVFFTSGFIRLVSIMSGVKSIKERFFYEARKKNIDNKTYMIKTRTIAGVVFFCCLVEMINRSAERSLERRYVF